MIKKGDFDRAISYYEEALNVSEKRRDYEASLNTLPPLIDSLSKIHFPDYPKIAHELSKLLELCEVPEFKVYANAITQFFLKSETFKTIDPEKLKETAEKTLPSTTSQKLSTFLNWFANHHILATDGQDEH